MRKSSSGSLATSGTLAAVARSGGPAPPSPRYARRPLPGRPPSTPSPSASRSPTARACSAGRRRDRRRGRARSAPSTSSRSTRATSCATSPSTRRAGRLGRASRRDRRARRRAGHRRHRPHVPPAPRRQDRAAQQATRSTPATTSRWPTRPGVARVCEAIADDPEKAFQYTIKRNTVAVVSDGTAVLGLGDIGPRAAMPVMEGKAMLFKEFAGVDAFPICLDTKDPDEIVATVDAPRAGVRRHQPRGHLRAALLRDRGAAEGDARHPGLPRRPARHRGRRRSPRCSTPASSRAGAARTLRVLVVGARRGRASR